MSEPDPSLPEVDERLVAPETRYEIEDGRVVYVPPADEPHGSLHAKLAAVIDAHRGPAYAVAVDMLTRTSRIDDIAPDVSVYPATRHPETGRRQLEELAFEVASTETLGHAATRAVKLVTRGVRRVFAIDVKRERALEWSPSLDAWSMLDRDSAIVDPALAVAVPVAALVDAVRADAAIPRAYRMQRHAEFIAEREEGREEGRQEGRQEGREAGELRGMVRALVAILSARGLPPSEAESARIAAIRTREQLDGLLARALTCSTVAELLAK